MDGRTVRCAKCKHSWFQDGPELAPAPTAAPAPPDGSPPATAATAQEAEPGTSGGADGPPPQPSVNHWRTSDRSDDAGSQAAPTATAVPAPPPAFEQVAEAAEEEPPAPEPAFSTYDEQPSQFDYEPPFRARRNPLKLWTAAALVFAVLASGTIVAVNYWGLPDWVPVARPTFAINQPQLQLEFPSDQQDRRTLPNGTEYFGASGTVTNIGRETASVPSILIVLRDERDRIVYSWEIVPPKSRLAPGETMTIKEAVTDIPRSAKFAEIGWKPG